jgi:hypothetical protein
LDESTQVPIVLADEEAKTRVQAMLWERWAKRSKFQFSTDLSYLAYEPGDVVNLTGQSGQLYPIRITKVTYDGKNILAFEGDPSISSIYPNVATTTAQGGSPSGFQPQQVPYGGPTQLAVLDIPPLRAQDTTQGLYLAACGYTSAWPGCYVDISRDDVNFSQLTALQNPTPMGATNTVLGNFSGGNIPDEINTLGVTLYEPTLTLSSVSYSSFLNGAQAALVGSEIVLFRTATQTAAGTYTLSGFLRGQLGTEWAMGTHAAGEQFVLLQPSTLAQMGINVSDIGSNIYFETYLRNILGNTPNGPITVTPSVARVKPFAPWLLAAGHGSASSASDITLNWLRRARVNTTWLDGTDVPLDESTEVYTVNIYNGATLVRAAVVTGPFTAPATPSYVYTAANISADGFSAGNTITFTVQQHSDQGVLGYAATASITR